MIEVVCNHEEKSATLYTDMPPLRVIWCLLSGYLASRLLCVISKRVFLYDIVCKYSNKQYHKFYHYWTSKD